MQPRALSSKASSSKAAALDSITASDSEDAADNNPTTPPLAKTRSKTSKASAVDPVNAEGKAKSTKRGERTGSRKRTHSVTLVSSESPSDLLTPDVTKRTRFAESESSLEISEITPAPATKPNQRKSTTGKASTTITTNVAEKKPNKAMKAKRGGKAKNKYTSKEFVGSDEEGEEERKKEEVNTAPQSTCIYSICINILLTSIPILQSLRVPSPSPSFAQKTPLG